MQQDKSVKQKHHVMKFLKVWQNCTRKESIWFNSSLENDLERENSFIFHGNFCWCISDSGNTVLEMEVLKY